VVRPPGRSDRSVAIFSTLVSVRGHSSCATPSTGAISRSNRPSLIAVTARRWLLYANSSITSRDRSQRVAIRSAARNWEISSSPYRCSHPRHPVYGSSKPNCAPTVIDAPMGIRLMLCTPPATTKSAVPLITACAAKCSACWLAPHCRSTVTPGTCSGNPAASQAVLAMSPACPPMVSTQPNTTSSTSIGSTSTRSSSAVIT
jgi:hypothetical protein